MEPTSPPPLWPVTNAFSTPWTPHPVDGPARRATMNFQAIEKARPRPAAAHSGPLHPSRLIIQTVYPTGPFQFDLHEAACLLTRHRVTGTHLHRQTVRQPIQPRIWGYSTFNHPHDRPSAGSAFQNPGWESCPSSPQHSDTV